MRKTKYYTIHIEFQERSSSQVYLLIWIFDGPNIKNEAGYIEFIGKAKKTRLPDHLNDPGLFCVI